MSHSADSLPDPKAVHARIARTLATLADPRFATILQIPAYARRHLPEHAAAGESLSEDIISRAIVPYLDVAVLKEASSSAELPLMPLVRKAAHAWTWEQPGRNAAALRFIAAAEQFDVQASDLLTPWRVSWAKSTGLSEILAKVDSFVGVDAGRLDGRIVVVTAARPGRVDLWDLASGQSIRLPYQSGGISAVAVESAADGVVFVSVGTEGGRVRCWFVRGTGTQRTEWLDVQQIGSFDVGDSVTALSVTSIMDRPHVLVGQANGHVSLLDCANEELSDRLIHEGEVTGVASVMLPNGVPAAISVGVDETLRLSHMGEELVPVPRGEFRSDDAIRAVATLRLPGGEAVAITAGDKGSVGIWDLPPESPRCRRIPGHEQDVTTLAAGIGPQGEALIVTGDSQGCLRIVDPHRARIMNGPIEGHRNRVTGLAFARTEDGRSIAISGGDDGIVRRWDLADTLLSDPMSAGQPAAVVAARPGTAPSPEPSIRLWRLEDGVELCQEAGTHSYRMVAVAAGRLADRTAIAVTDAGYSSRTSARHGTIVAITTAVRPDGHVVAVSASTDDCLRLWDLTACPDAGPRLTRTVSHPGVRSVIIASRADGWPVAISAGRDRALKIWDLQHFARLGKDLVGHHRPVTALATAAAPGLRTVVVSGSEDTTLRIWDVASGDPIGRSFRGHRRQITALAATYADDSLITVTSCKGDGVVRKWDLLRADPRPQELIGHNGPVTAVAISGSSERRVVVTASEDRTVRVWDLMSSAPLLDPMPIPGTVRAIACFHGSGPGAIVAGDDVLAVVRWKLS
jgi:WD40 repeat protein